MHSKLVGDAKRMITHVLNLETQGIGGFDRQLLQYDMVSEQQALRS